MRRASSRPVPGSAWDLVLRGDVVLAGGTAVGFEHVIAARKLYEEALRIDPSFVPALVSVAMTLDNAMTNDFGADRPTFAQRQEEMDKLTDQAVRIDAGDASAWFLRAEALGWLGRWDEALAANTKAEALDPTSSTYASHRAYIVLAADRPEEALVLAERAAAMDQVFESEGFSVRMVCESNLMLGRYGEAVRACEAAAARDNWWLDQAWLVAGYAQQEETAKAAVAAAELLKRQPGFTIDKFKASDPAARNPAYLRRAETHLYAGLRKAGLPDR